MIILNLLLDILINNFTMFTSTFVIANIFYITKNKYYLIFLVAMFLDLVIMHTYFFNLIIFNTIYWGEFKLLKLKNKIAYNLIGNTLNYIIFLGGIYLYFNYQNINIVYCLKILLFNYPLYFIYLLISYKIIQKA